MGITNLGTKLMLFTTASEKKQLRNDFDAGNFRRQFANDSEKLFITSVA